MICLHHNDADGWSSAAIVYKNYIEETTIKNIRFHEMAYFDELPEIKKDEHVVDFSLQGEGQWEELLAITQNVIWIDHHKTAIDQESFPHHLEGSRVDGVAACVLTWKYFYKDKEIPTGIKLIADYDVWTFKYKLDTMFFFNGMYAMDGANDPTSLLYDQLLDLNDKTWQEIIHEGSYITKYLDKSHKSNIRRHSILIHFEGLRICVVNSSTFGSPQFDSIDPSKYDAVSVYQFTGKKWKISFYTPHLNIDVSIIAMKYGGGGHARSCACLVDELPFDFTNIVKED